jgi:putative ABC transport system ATP-binding protein
MIPRTQPEPEPVIEVVDLVKDYRQDGNAVHALRSVSLGVMPGEFAAIMGPSGSGKSTFMNLIGCLDRPTSGTYRLDGVEVTQLSTSQLADIRSRKLGFVFQGFLLLPRMDALQNVMLPMMYAGVPEHVREARARGLAHRAGRRPTACWRHIQEHRRLSVTNPPGTRMVAEASYPLRRAE